MLKKKDYETNDMFSRKEYFIKILNPDNKNNLEYGINLANILNNILILKCRYPDEIEKKVLDICNKININCNIR